jgi:hypothetical protein
MAMIKEARNCKQCHKRVVADVRTANHVLHLLLSLLTGGLWLIVWLICAGGRNPGICPQCGGKC